MDITNKYVEMCTAAKEIQNVFFGQQTKRAYGGLLPSFVYDRTMQRVGVLIWTPSLLRKHLNLTDNYLIISVEHEREVGNKTKPESIQDTCIWLPRQDQLQDMLGSKSSLRYLDCFQNLVYQLNCGLFRGQSSLSFEQLWLAFVLKEKYSKIWDNKKKEWIKYYGCGGRIGE